MRLPLPHLRRGESALPLPSPIVTKATLSPRPNGQKPHSYRPRSDNWSGGDENRSRSRSPFSPHSVSGEDERKKPDDRSRVEGPGLGPTDHDPTPGTTRVLVDTTPLPTPGTRHGTRTSSGPMGNNRHTSEVPRRPTGSTHSPTTSSDSHMLKTTHSGTGLVPTTARSRRTPH